MALHCAECGFVNPEGGNYCQKCGALIGAEGGGDATTATYRVGETGDFIPVDLDEMADDGAALVIRAGGGRAGESFAVRGEQMTIGRRPDSAVFLDDITVSRDHALLVKRGSSTTAGHSTAPTSTASESTRSDSTTATSCRSANTS